MNAKIFMVILLIIGLSANPVHAQNAFYDAQVLAGMDINYINSIKKDPEKLNFTAEETAEFDTIVDFLQNPWKPKSDKIKIEILFKAIERYERSPSDERVDKYLPLFSLPQFIPSALSTFTNSTFQSNLIDATATIIAERFKEELTALYIEKFKKALKDEALQALIPETGNLIFNRDPFSYLSLGNEWKTAFEKDLKNILQNLISFIETTEIEKYKILSKNKYYPYLKLSIDISDKLINGYHPIDLLAYLDIRYKDHTDNNSTPENELTYRQFYNVIHLLNLLQYNLRDVRKGTGTQFANVWVDFSALKELDTPKEIEYFLALIYQQDTEFFDANKSIFLNYFKNRKADELNNYFSIYLRNKILPFYQVLVKINGFDKKGDKNPETYADYMQLFLDLIVEADRLIARQEIDKIHFNIAQKGLDIYKALYKKDYSIVIVNTVYIIDKILIDPDQKDKEILLSLSRFGSLMVGIANAKNSSEMKEVISNIILPPGTSHSKRTNRFSISVTAHPGLYAGKERLYVTDSNAKNIGFTAPLGLDLTIGTKNGCIGLFIMMLDLGAVVNYRITEKTESELPEKITFKQVFSPGISVGYGFSHPMTVSIGAQYTPELRKVTKENGSTIDSNSFRYYVRLSWDLPLLTLYPRLRNLRK